MPRLVPVGPLRFFLFFCDLFRCKNVGVAPMGSVHRGTGFDKQVGESAGGRCGEKKTRLGGSRVQAVKKTTTHPAAALSGVGRHTTAENVPDLMRSSVTVLPPIDLQLTVTR